MILWVFISWEPPPLRYIKVHFDRIVRDRRGGVSFIIHGPGLGLMAIERSYLFESIVLVVELYGAWAGIAYAWRILRADHLIIKGDLAMVVTWI